MNLTRQLLRTVFLAIFVFATCSATPAAERLSIGLEVLATGHPDLVAGKKIALLVGLASYDQSMRHTADRLARATTIKAIFTGDPWPRKLIGSASGTKQIDALTQAPVHIIRDPLEKPRADQLNGAEIIVIDIQDIGIRFFHAVTLLAQFLELGKQAGVPVFVLDRPNPIGASKVSGPLLDVQFRSRFGVYPIPLVYGMTFGELALFFNKVFGLNADLTVVGMENYQRDVTYRNCGLHWTMPSEHLPDPESPLYYATTGFLGEMGIFSTGVGTTRPFHYVLAPWIDPDALISKLTVLNLPGVAFLPTTVRPYYGLFQQKRVPGIEIVVTDHSSYDPVVTGIAILHTLWTLYPDKIPLSNQTAAEGVDTLLGGSDIRTAIIQKKGMDEIRSRIRSSVSDFLTKRKQFLIYPEAQTP
ncbi:MAG: hypothetical protein BWY66_02225 [bacterium ADurb.Bin374]|nr:MAG: hypothetical protein BWY66_02225 [bacterium ADurb.Bin374]